MNNLNHNQSSENAWVTAQAALSTGTPQPRLASRRVPRLTFSHLASYPPYASTGQTNARPPAVNNNHPSHESTGQSNANTPHGDADELI